MYIRYIQMCREDPSSASMDCRDNGSDDEDRNSVEAGVVRGFFRSLVRFPAVGRLPAGGKAVPKVPQSITKTMPKPLPTIVPKTARFPHKLPATLKTASPAARPVRVGGGVWRRRVPVKDVARISDRVSQGLDVYEIATQQHDAQWKRSQLSSFVTSLAKNTILGLVVFESYGAVLEYAASRASSPAAYPYQSHTESRDPYARAPPAVHALAGAVGGGAHGLLAFIWECVTGTFSSLPSPGIHRYVIHHGTAHAVLFGVYEASKRSLQSLMENDKKNNIQRSSMEYLSVVAVAGGLAGQAQHWISHYSEHLLILSQSRTGYFALPPQPAFRPMLLAFLPSSIAFVAFEYGRATD